MRLLRRFDDGAFSLTNFVNEKQLPPYAILSHTWTDGQEVTYSDLLNSAEKGTLGWAKLSFCATQAAKDGLDFFWVDTCCIDKSNSTELGTAINSMFRWYERAVKCYVYLSDVSSSEGDDGHRVEQLRKSRWFTRGWTLQELLAPSCVEFFCKGGSRLGDRISLMQTIHDICSLPMAVLGGKSKPSDYSVKEKFLWAHNRVTTLEEDRMYCLLGIFGVYLPLIYGEGEAHARRRLEDEIRRRNLSQSKDRLRDNSASLLPFARDDRFTGREDQLEALENTLISTDRHQRMTVYGLGGCGKSALALEFGYRALAECTKDFVFWVPALSRQSFEDAYHEIAASLEIPGLAEPGADIGKLVKNALSTTEMGGWLMIVDNADDPEVLLDARVDGPNSRAFYDYLPRSSNGAILFTTRSRKVAGRLSPGHVLDLVNMSEADIKQLLARHISDRALLDDSQAIDHLLNILTYLPLAVVQAAAFMSSNSTAVSDYVNLIKDAGAEMEVLGENFEDSSRYREVDSTIMKTWHISFKQIRAQDPLAADYLSFIACIDRINIPQSVLPPGRSLVQQVKSIGTLTGYAFLSERQNSGQEGDAERFFDMHRLVHMTLIKWLRERGDQSQWLGEATSRVEELLPYGGHERPRRWAPYISHAIHLAGIDETSKAARISLLERVGFCQASLGQYAAAEAQHRQVIPLRKDLFGPDHTTVLASTNNVFHLLEKQGKYDEALLLGERTVTQYEELLGPNHTNTLISMSNLAIVLNRLGKYEEAESMSRTSIDRMKTLLSEEHPSVLTTTGVLIEALDKQGKFEEADALSGITLVRKEKVYGPEHPHTLASMTHEVLSLARQGKYAEVEAMSRESMARYAKVLGPEHPDTLTSAGNLARQLGRLQKYDESFALFDKTCAQMESVLGKDHPTSKTCRANYAEAQWWAAQPQYGDATTPSTSNSTAGAQSAKSWRLVRGLAKFGIRRQRAGSKGKN